MPVVAGSCCELTILMPCLNEAETVGTCLEKARLFLDRMGIAGELVVADNGSTDGSQAIARAAGARVVDVPVRGYGAALHAGSLAAEGLYIIMGDADDSYDFSSLMPFVEKLRGGADLVMGNRFAGGILPGAMPFKNRYLGNPVLSGVGRLLFGSPVGDFHCGLRGYTREAFLALDLRTTGMEFASEMVIKATLLGMGITEVPTTLKKDGRSRPPHLRPWRDGWRHLRFMMLYSPEFVFLYPGAVLMLAGGVFGALLLPGPLVIGGVAFDIHSLLVAAFSVILGFQCVTFAAFTRVFADVEGLVPRGRTLSRLFGLVTLETGLLVGGSAFGAGLVGLGLTVEHWKQRAFGSLDPGMTFRAAIPSTMLLAIGGEIILASFFLSMLGLRLRGREQT